MPLRIEAGEGKGDTAGLAQRDDSSPVEVEEFVELHQVGSYVDERRGDDVAVRLVASVQTAPGARLREAKCLMGKMRWFMGGSGLSSWQPGRPATSPTPQPAQISKCQPRPHRLISRPTRGAESLHPGHGNQGCRILHWNEPAAERTNFLSKVKSSEQ